MALNGARALGWDVCPPLAHEYFPSLSQRVAGRHHQP